MNDATREHGQAAAWFTGILTLAMGGAGLLVAGMVLGFDYLLHGDPSEREQLSQARAQQRRDRYADALAWLEVDRAARARERQAKRAWFAEDPATRGVAPSSGETIGRLAGRAWNRLLVGAVRFGRGWTQGRQEAQQRRAAGDTDWWKPVRVESTVGEPLAEPTTAAPDETPRPAGAPKPQPSTQPARPAPDDIVDAEIIPDPAPSTSDIEVVPVGQDEPQRPDETVDEYRRRLEDLKNEVQQNHNGHRADPAQPARR